MAYIKDLREKVPQVRASWSRPESIHLTLKFLGEIPLTKVESFTLAAERAVEGFTPFRLGVGGTGVFPPHGSKTNPRKRVLKKRRGPFIHTSPWGGCAGRSAG
jgi:2'-5' RNA ligase